MKSKPEAPRKKPSHGDVRMLLKVANKSRLESLRYVTAEFNKCHEQSVGMSTVRRVLHENGMQNYVVVIKPFIYCEHQKTCEVESYPCIMV